MNRHQQRGPGSPPPPEPGPWIPGDSAETLLVTGVDVLRSEVERIVAAAGGQLRTVQDVAEAAPFWDAAAAVLVGSDIRELPPRRRAPAVLLGLKGDGDGLWHLAAAVGAERVAVLPDAAAWLAEYLSRSRAPEAGGLVLGLTGGCGGAGATTAAIWIAQAAAGTGIRVLLIDGDPWGGGLELALAAEDAHGLRWPDLAGVSGSIDPAQLDDALPVAGGFSFLSWPGTRDRAAGVDASTVAAVLDAARRGCELVVLDIGRDREALAGLRRGMRPDHRRCARPAAGRRRHGLAAAGASTRGHRARGPGQSRRRLGCAADRRTPWGLSFRASCRTSRVWPEQRNSAAFWKPAGSAPSAGSPPESLT